MSYSEERLIIKVLRCDAGTRAIVYRACFKSLPTVLNTPRPLLYLADKCAITCNRKYCNIGLLPALCTVNSVPSKNTPGAIQTHRFHWIYFIEQKQLVYLFHLYIVLALTCHFVCLRNRPSKEQGYTRVPFLVFEGKLLWGEIPFQPSQGHYCECAIRTLVLC